MIGIFGGTFDPVHYGHLKPAWDVKLELGLNKVLFIPNNIPPHRKQPELTTAQRIELLQLATADYDGFDVDMREVERQGKSYMVDTLASLKKDFQEETVCLIIGMDAFQGLTRWHRWQSLFDYCHVVVTARPGFELPEELDEFLKQRLVQDTVSLGASPAGKILIKSASLLDISASEIRQKARDGESLLELLPDAVAQQYITMISGDIKQNAN